MTSDGLAGTGVLQSPEEWDARNRVLATTMSELINGVSANGGSADDRAIDIGCQSGTLTDAVAAQTPYAWTGIDPTISEPGLSDGSLELLPGTADALPFASGAFKVAMFANVYEHVQPDRRAASLLEIRRVLAPGGYLVGQIPNPYFPIESHSRLPFMGWLPMRAQKVYWRLSPVPWEHDFFVVTMRELRATAERLGYATVEVRNFNYPLEVIPQALRTAAHALERPMRHVPWAWQFVFQSHA